MSSKLLTSLLVVMLLSVSGMADTKLYPFDGASLGYSAWRYSGNSNALYDRTGTPLTFTGGQSGAFNGTTSTSTIPKTHGRLVFQGGITPTYSQVAANWVIAPTSAVNINYFLETSADDSTAQALLANPRSAIGRADSILWLWNPVSLAYQNTKTGALSSTANVTNTATNGTPLWNMYSAGWIGIRLTGSEYINCGNIANFSGNEITIFVEFKAKKDVLERYLYAKNSYNQYKLSHLTSGKLRASIGTSTQVYDLDSTKALVDGDVYIFVFVYNGANIQMHIYSDGVLYDTSAKIATGNINQSSNNLYLGWGGATNTNYLDTIYSFLLYPRAMSDAEIRHMTEFLRGGN